jgi:hypothetical protein
VPGGVTGWHHSPAHVALLALAGAGILAGGLGGVTVAGSLYPSARAVPQAVPSIAEQQRAAPAVRTSLAVGATSSASRWPTPAVSTAATARPRAHARPRGRHHVAPAAQVGTQVVPARAPVARAPAPATSSPASAPAATRGGAVSAPVNRPAPVVVAPAPSPAPIRTPAPKPAPKPAAPAPQPTAAFDDSG